MVTDPAGSMEEALARALHMQYTLFGHKLMLVIHDVIALRGLDAHPNPLH